jgi:alanine racemase
MTLKSRVVHLKKVPAGFSVSYGCTYQTDKPTVIATVPVGYGDGYDRLLSSKGDMLVRGHRAPVAGRVCMDMTMLDAGHIPDVRVGDEVVILGKQSDESVTADDIASRLTTINYEVVTRLMPRVKRVFIQQ